MGQHAQFPVAGGDIPVTNYGGTDIAANVAVKFDTTAGNYLGVLPLTGADAGKGRAVTLDTIKAGKQGRVRVAGAALMTADGALSAGDVVKAGIDAGEEGHAKACGAAEAQFGFCLTNAADNAEVLVWIDRAKNA
jgi:hypothetical protein